jgi:hypothetical protein
VNDICICSAEVRVCAGVMLKKPNKTWYRAHPVTLTHISTVTALLVSMMATKGNKKAAKHLYYGRYDIIRDKYFNSYKAKAVLVHATEELGGEEVYSSYSFSTSTSALGGGEWSASRPGRALVPGKRTLVRILQEAGWAPEPPGHRG